MGFMDGIKQAQENKKLKEEFKEKSTQYIVDKEEVLIADTTYKSYITDGASRLDKVNGRLLAANSLKLDKIIEQNDEIIELLKKISENQK